MVKVKRNPKIYYVVLTIVTFALLATLFLKGNFILRGRLQNSIEKKYSIQIKIESTLIKDNMLFVLFTTKDKKINIAAFKQYLGGNIIASLVTTLNKENKNVYYSEYTYSNFGKENFYYIVYGYNGNRSLSSYEISFNNGKITKDIYNDDYFINEYHSTFKDIPRPDTFKTIDRN